MVINRPDRRALTSLRLPLSLLLSSSTQAVAQEFDCALERIALAFDSNEPNEYTSHPALSGDGRFLAFASYASNLVPSDIFGLSCVGAGVPYCSAKLNSQGLPANDHFQRLAQRRGQRELRDLRFPSGEQQERNPLLRFRRTKPALPRGRPVHSGALHAHGRTVLRRQSPTADDCSGRFTLEFNPFVAADVSVTSGTTLFAQSWYRDQAASFGTGLTDALRLMVGP